MDGMWRYWNVWNQRCPPGFWSEQLGGQWSHLLWWGRLLVEQVDHWGGEGVIGWPELAALSSDEKISFICR